MALPVEMFPLLTPQQISPLMTGIEQSNQLYAQTMQNKYLQPQLQAALQKQQIANQISEAQANVAPQMNAAQLAYMQARTPNLNATTQYIINGQIPLAQAQAGAASAQAGLIGTETAKNRFFLNNPGTLLPGLPGQIADLSVLRDLNPELFGQNTAAPPTQNQNVVSDIDNTGIPFRIPGIGSAGDFSTTNAPSPDNSSQILPSNPYAGAAGTSQTTNGLPTFQDATNLLINSMLAQPRAQMARADYYTKMANGYDFKSMPPDSKSYAVAQLAGMGIEPTEAAKLLNNGQTITSVATQLGLDPSQLPSPIYAATPKTIALIQQRNQALNEINTIMPNINSAMSPFARQIIGYSPSQIVGAISNSNPDIQARFLAAKALMPEMASLRLKAMGGNIGIEAIKEVNNQSMGNIKSFQGLVSPKVYSAAQDYVDQWITQGATAANKVGLAGSLGNLPSGGQVIPQNTPTPPTQQMVTMRAPDGNLFRIPSNNVAAAIKIGASNL